jgi:hypothetical protein
MAGYLDHYGAGEERREKIIKRALLLLAVVLVVGGAATFFFYNFKQERQVSRFVELLESRRYDAAYALWVSSDSDRKAYPLASFLEDWGPQSPHADVAGFKISKSRSCGSGVILTVDFAKGRQEKLWVQRKDLTIGFSPLPGCPAPR